MGEFVVVQSFKDKGGVHENGVRRVISRHSRVADDGYINVYDDYDVNIRTSLPPKKTLLLITPDQERIYTDLTKAQWNALVVNAASYGGNTVTFTKEFVIAAAGLYPPGPEIIDVDLYDGEIHQMMVSGQPIMSPENIYDPTYSATEGRLRMGDLPAGGIILVDGDIVRVTIELPLS